MRNIMIVKIYEMAFCQYISPLNSSAYTQCVMHMAVKLGQTYGICIIAICK